MNVTIDRVQIPFLKDSFGKRQQIPFKKHGASTGSREHGCGKVMNDSHVDAIAREKRKTNIEEFEKRILLRRWREQTRSLPPRQLKMLRSLPFFSSEQYESTKSSSSSSVSPKRSRSPAIISSVENASAATLGEGIIDLPDGGSKSLSFTASSSRSASPSRLVRFNSQQADDSMSSVELNESEINDEEKYGPYHEAKQYRALMKAVCENKYDKSPCSVKKGRLKASRPKDLMDQSFDRLRDAFGSSVPWPEEAFFEVNFDSEPDMSSMVVDIVELVTVPDELARYENCELSGSAAIFRMAAWDHIFFKHRKEGAKNFVSFCKLMEGETPVDKFIYPSPDIANFAKLEHLWKPLMETQVLERYCTWVLKKKKDGVPEYLVKNGYIRDMMDKLSKNPFSRDGWSEVRRETLEIILNMAKTGK